MTISKPQAADSEQEAKIGRPRIDIDLEKVKDLAALGMSKKHIALMLGIGVRTFYDRLRDEPEFSQAVDAGRAQGIGTIAHARFQAAVNGNSHAQEHLLKIMDPLTYTPEIVAARALEQQRRDELDDLEGNRIELEVTVVPGLPRPEDMAGEAQDHGN